MEGGIDGFVVRQATADDLESCVQLGMTHVGGERGTWLTRFGRDLEEPRRLLVVAEAEPGLLGYGRVAYCVPPEDGPANVAPEGYYLSGVLVRPDARRLGVGRALTEARVAWVRRRAAEIWYFTNARNGASLQMHAELGFEEITRDFTFPDVTFDGGEGVLCKASFS